MPSLSSSLRRLVSGRAPARAAQDASSIWSNAAYRRIWAASTLSDFGAFISVLAIPLTAVITLDASAFQMGLLTAIEALPFVAFGLLAGLLVDRAARRTLVIAADWLRAGLLALIPLSAVLDLLSVPLLMAVAFGVGCCSLVFQVAQSSLLPSLLPTARLTAGNARIEASYAAAQATGPGLAGVLIGIASAPFAIVINAATFAVSALILRGLPSEPPRERPSSRSDPGAGRGRRHRSGVAVRVAGRDIADGLRAITHQPILRAALLASTTINLFGYLFLAVYILFMSRSLGLSELTIGIVLSLGGVGAVAGALLSDPLQRRLGFGRTMVWAMVVCCLASVLVPLALAIPSQAVALLAAAELLQYGTLAMFNIGGRTLRQVLAADEVQGRVNATARTLAGAGTLIGSLAGGILGGVIGLGPTLVVGAIGMMLAIPVVVISPLGTLHHLPDRLPGETTTPSVAAVSPLAPSAE